MTILLLALLCVGVSVVGSQDDEEYRQCLKMVPGYHLPNVRYDCADAHVIHQCDGQILQLHCNDGKRVQILDAFYGRYDDDVCPFTRAVGAARSDECEDQQTNSRIKQLLESNCSGRVDCQVTVNPRGEHGAYAWFVNGQKDPCGIDVPKFVVVVAKCLLLPTTTAPIRLPVSTGITPSHVTNSSRNVSVAQAQLHAELDKTTSTAIDRVSNQQTRSAAIGQCPATEMQGVQWPSTNISTVAVKNCRELGNMQWLCTRQGLWHVAGPDTSDCRSRAVEQLLANSSNVDNPVQLLQQTATLTSNLTLQAGDLSLLVNTLSTASEWANTEQSEATTPVLHSTVVSDTQTQQQMFLETVVLTTSNMLAPEQRDAWQAQPNRTDLACRIIDSVESVAFAYARRVSETNDISPQTLIRKDSVQVQVQVVKMQSDRLLQSDFATADSLPPVAKQNTVEALNVQLNVDAYVGKYIPQQDSVTDLLVVLAQFRNLAHYIQSDKQQNNPSASDKPFVRQAQVGQDKQPSRVNSDLLITDIVSASVRRLNDANQPVSSPSVNVYDSADRRAVVLFELNHTTSNVSGGERVCAFWYSGNNQSSGYWSNEGCWRVDESEQSTNRTRCACSHLTNFAVLLDTSGILRDTMSQANEIALTLLTLIGCGLSCVSALLAFVLFSITKVYKGRFPERNTIHKNMCINLCVAQFCLLINIVVHSELPMAACTVIGVLQHLFFLVTFSWISLEGVQLFIMLVIVFETKSSLKPIFYSIGYGVPVLIVSISAAIRPNGYVNNKMCWLTTEDGFMWAFAAPVALVLVINYVVFAVAWITIGRHSARRAQRSDSNRPCIANEHEPAGRVGSSNSSSAAASSRVSVSTSSQQTAAAVRSWLKGASVLCVLLGLTWIFGFLLWTSPTASLVFAYLFTVLNSVQGIFILLLHFLIDAKVRNEAWNRVQRLRVARWLVHVSSRSNRSSHKPPSGGQQPRVSSSSRLSALLRGRRSSSNPQSGSHHSFNTVLSLFGRRIALRRNRKSPLQTSDSAEEALQKCISEHAKEKLLAGQIIMDPEDLEAKVRQQGFATPYDYPQGNNTAAGLEQYHAKFFTRFLAQPEDFSVTSVAEPSYVVSASNSNSQVSDDCRDRSSNSDSRFSSSISPFPTQYPPTYAQAVEATPHEQQLLLVPNCRSAGLSRNTTLMHTDSAYGTQPDDRSRNAKDKRKRDEPEEPTSQFDSEALSSYCDSRILTEFAETVVVSEQHPDVQRHKHHHKCGCERSSSLTSSDPKQRKNQSDLSRSDSLDDRGRSTVDLETEDELALWKDGLTDSISSVTGSDVTSTKERSSSLVQPKGPKKPNYDKVAQARLSALLTVVAEKDFESDVSDGELFNITDTSHAVVDCRENDAFERSNSNSVGEDVHSSVNNC